MLPERKEWQMLYEQFTESDGEDEDEEADLDSDHLDLMYQSIFKGDGEDAKRLLFLNFDIPAHQQLLVDLLREQQMETARVIQWCLDEYFRLFPLS